MFPDSTASARSIIFLFGAGASHGAGDILPEAPPLGLQLYGELARIYPGSWGSLPREVCEALKANFEDGMQVIYDRMSVLIPELMRQMAIYFIQFRPASGQTLYCRLIEHIRELGLLDRVLFSTLNYECVLEFSLLRKGISIDYFGLPAADVSVPVWKLHGSCNMFATGVTATPGVTYTAGAKFEGGLEGILDSSEAIGRWLYGTALAPAMCLYMRGKPLAISPAAVSRLQSMWFEALQESTVIFCVGVNPNAEDKHVWEPIASSPGQLYFIGGAAAFDGWTRQHRPNRSKLLGSRFETGIGNIIRSLAQHANH